MSDVYVSEETLRSALARLQGTAGHLLKIWLVLKHMGLEEDEAPVRIDTSNSEPSLVRLFDFGEGEDGPEGRRFFIPFANSKRWSTMKGDASRSIIQTNIRRWADSQSVVTCDPTEFLDIRGAEDSAVEVRTSRSYPLGLGHGESGFAREEDSRVALPLQSFAAWYGRRTGIPAEEDPSTFLVDRLLSELHISPIERSLIFQDDEDLEITVEKSVIADSRLRAICQPYIDGDKAQIAQILSEPRQDYVRRVSSMIPHLNLPNWLRPNAETEVKALINDGASAILLYGPPRTGKTRLIDELVDRDAPERATIQLHDGWSYEHLIEGFMPDEDGAWRWKTGLLKSAIDEGKTAIVIEEINRTELTQALGEVFSLVEPAYRGKSHTLTLRSGAEFYIPEEVVFFMTMNTVDKSTEEIDDALLGRLSAVEVPPSVEILADMLAVQGVDTENRDRLSQVFAAIQDVYPLGHGYYAGLTAESSPADIRLHYKTRIRPVLSNFLGELRYDELAPIDNLMDDLFSGS
jgi:5-methylcytosine-specific restriction protein B